MAHLSISYMKSVCKASQGKHGCMFLVTDPNSFLGNECMCVKKDHVLAKFIRANKHMLVPQGDHCEGR